MSSCLVVDIKLSGFTDRMFSVLYPLLVFIAVSRFCLSSDIRVRAFLCRARFSGVLLGQCAMLWRSGSRSMMGPTLRSSCFVVHSYVVLALFALMPPPLCFGVLGTVFLVSQSCSCVAFLWGGGFVLRVVVLVGLFSWVGLGVYRSG